MSSRMSYWVLGVILGVTSRVSLPQLGGHAPGLCGNSDDWLVLPGFLSMVVMAEIVAAIKKIRRAVRSRGKTSDLAEKMD